MTLNQIFLPHEHFSVIIPFALTREGFRPMLYSSYVWFPCSWLLTGHGPQYLILPVDMDSLCLTAWWSCQHLPLLWFSHYISHKAVQHIRRWRIIKEKISLELCMGVSFRHQNNLQRITAIICGQWSGSESRREREVLVPPVKGKNNIPCSCLCTLHSDPSVSLHSAHLCP